MNKLFKLFLFIFIIAIFTCNSNSQNRINRSLPIDRAANSEIIYLDSESKDSVNISLIFAIDNSALVYAFQQISGKSDYFAYPQLEISLTDSNGIIKRRILWNDTLVKSETKNNKLLKKVISFKTPKIKYSISAVFSDIKGNYAWKDNFEIKTYNVLTHAPVFYTNSSNQNEFCALGGKMPFGEESVFAFLPLSVNTAKELKVLIKRQKSDIAYRYWNFAKDTQFTIKCEKIGGLQINESSATFSFNSSKNLWGAKFEIPSKNMPPGIYNVYVIDGKDTINKSVFTSVWQDIPKYLLNVEKSIKLAELIFTENELENTLKENEEKKLYSLIKLWNSKFPASDIYNPAFHEFFRRADIAETEMQTFGEKSGVNSDRGKVLILNGRADEIQRNTLDNKTTETWIYKKLKKEYYFETISNGIFRLKSIKDVK